MALLELDKKYPMDKRFDRLGELTKLGKYDAKGRVIDLWLICIEETKDIRTAEDVDNLCGWFEEIPFVELMIKARLAEKAEGGYRIKGVQDRMAWLVDYRGRQDKIKVIGGKARAATAERDERGHFKASRTPADVQHSAGENPAEPSASSPSATVPCSLIPDSVPDTEKNSENCSAGQDAGSSAGESTAPITNAHIEACKQTWRETLKHFGQKRNLTMDEERLIGKAIQDNKSVEIVDIALFGARHESSHEGWHPKDHVDIARILTKSKDGKPRIQKFYGYGIAEKEKQAAREVRKNELDRTRGVEPSAVSEQTTANPERARAITEQIRKGRAV